MFWRRGSGAPRARRGRGPPGGCAVGQGWEAGLDVEQPVCEEFSVDAAKVERLRRELAAARGLAELFKALADETRARIAYALAREELCVCDIAGLLGVSVATASHHLRVLRQMGLVRYRRAGKFVYYALDDDHVARLLENAMEHLKEVRR